VTDDKTHKPDAVILDGDDTSDEAMQAQAQQMLAEEETIAAEIAANPQSAASSEPTVIVSGGVVNAASASVLEVLVQQGYEELVLEGLGQGTRNIGSSAIVSRSFLENPDTAKAKVCGEGDLDCFEGIDPASSEINVPEVEAASIVRDQSSPAASTEAEVYVPEVSVVEDRQIVQNEVRS